jgi:hypothetical protein
MYTDLLDFYFIRSNTGNTGKFLPILKSPKYQKTGFGIAGIGNTSQHARRHALKRARARISFFLLKNFKKNIKTFFQKEVFSNFLNTSQQSFTRDCMYMGGDLGGDLLGDLGLILKVNLKTTRRSAKSAKQISANHYLHRPRRIVKR